MSSIIEIALNVRDHSKMMGADISNPYQANALKKLAKPLEAVGSNGKHFFFAKEVARLIKDIIDLEETEAKTLIMRRWYRPKIAADKLHHTNCYLQKYIEYYDKVFRNV